MPHLSESAGIPVINDREDVNGDQYQRTQSYDHWDGDLRWPIPPFQQGEMARAEAVQRQRTIALQEQNVVEARLRAHQADADRRMAALSAPQGQSGEPRRPPWGH